MRAVSAQQNSWYFDLTRSRGSAAASERTVLRVDILRLKDQRPAVGAGTGAVGVQLLTKLSIQARSR